MPHHRLLLPLLVAALALAACDFAAEPSTRAEEIPSELSAPLRASNAAAAELYRVVETYFDQYLALNPVRASELGDHRFDDRFGDYASMSWMADSLGIEQEALEKLQAIDRKQLAGEDLVTYAAFKRQRELGIGGYRYPSELLAINSFSNWPGVFAQLGSGQGAHPFRTTRDYDNFLARMDGFVAWVDQAINNLRAGVTKGVVLPQIVVERTLPQLEAFGRLEDPRQTVFWQPLLNFPAGPSAADRRRLLQAYDDKLRTKVLPAYRRLHDYLAREYLPRARESVSWSNLPSGDLWYAYLVRYYTSTDMTPADVHELGQREVARLRASLAGLQGVPGIAGEPRAVFDALRADAKLQFGNAQSMLAGYAALRERVDARLPALFLRRPQSTFAIRPIEDFRAAAAASASYLPPNAGRAGVFYVNTSDLTSRPSYAMDALYLGEAVPGHLYQAAIAQETPDLPRFRRFGDDATFVAGWALYAESLGADLGLYADPYSQFGAIDSELRHAAALVVDTGLHAQGWSHQRAAEYLRANTALGEADIAAELDRYIARPGQALADKIGQLKILELRRRAEQRLGERFDVREFHEQVIGSGPLPLSVLETRINRWIDVRRQRRDAPNQ
ncbi:MAG: DUF885 domain-containing protein [Gammaproteobacteria bacterium]|nr:DUF885 domain-containing protein [Gammaproteobacteria bacterium]MDH5271634.1 DUF885 domain-containing protein [Gammaproteobacteria bacterium]